MTTTEARPRVALTMGDVAGIGPEVIARAWADPVLHGLCQPIVIGDPDVLRKALALVGSRLQVQRIDQPEEANATRGSIPCLVSPSIRELGSLSEVPAGRVDSARAERLTTSWIPRSAWLSKDESTPSPHCR